ncbi:hypothetical protein PUND_a1172 [Pseudoalteromonas undina]|jgi:hypothetical protein|uniref:Orphan protein n=1 Tax=Pseudoalteromonas undina TaxID=43660 RepID=A0ABP2XVD8_9GAMM|nr:MULTISPECIES: hypothetical protein [Pseudoalteromonas]OLF76405.1 hypothetical protein AWH60_06330 [Pseudoalteromonas haloplanktis]KAF7765488.1 hypothetical protein PUND_a1172 [Pseudoalteromonas undina]KPH91100.1 hypothetical protein AMS57_08900 [Pseudoalteromonas undina]MCK8129046.1 hypothetical protein [Pseudoalteromonas sp. 2CM39R]PWS55492.1 hypothetical protein DK924_01605 [Pseudoalteromonas sp. meg-B1]
MKTFIKTSLVAFSFAVVAGCQSQAGNPALNQCAQQSYQCETSCEQQTTTDSLKSQVCSSKCIEAYNQCKVQAENLGKATN